MHNRKFRNRDISKFHAQLCVAIFLKLLIFLVGIGRTENAAVCTLMSVLIQYFTLASVMWMCAEAVLMFQKLIIVFGRITTTNIVTMTLVCWCKLICLMHCNDFKSNTLFTAVYLSFINLRGLSACHTNTAALTCLRWL